MPKPPLCPANCGCLLNFIPGAAVPRCGLNTDYGACEVNWGVGPGAWGCISVTTANHPGFANRDYTGPPTTPDNPICFGPCTADTTDNCSSNYFGSPALTCTGFSNAPVPPWWATVAGGAYICEYNTYCRCDYVNSPTTLPYPEWSGQARCDANSLSWSGASAGDYISDNSNINSIPYNIYFLRQAIDQELARRNYTFALHRYNAAVGGYSYQLENFGWLNDESGDDIFVNPTATSSWNKTDATLLAVGTKADADDVNDLYYWLSYLERQDGSNPVILSWTGGTWPAAAGSEIKWEHIQDLADNMTVVQTACLCNNDKITVPSNCTNNYNPACVDGNPTAYGCGTDGADTQWYDRFPCGDCTINYSCPKNISCPTHGCSDAGGCTVFVT